VPKLKDVSPEAPTTRDSLPPEVKAAFAEFTAREGKERRSSPRIPMKLAVHVEPCPAFKDGYETFTDNVGKGGLRLKCDRECDVGVAIRLRLELTAERSLLLTGTVAWIHHGLAVGVHFDPLPADASATLNDLVSRGGPAK
jgi:hypothetical protein